METVGHILERIKEIIIAFLAEKPDNLQKIT